MDINTFLRYFPENTWVWWTCSDFWVPCVWNQGFDHLAVLHVLATIETCNNFPINDMYDVKICVSQYCCPTFMNVFSLFPLIFLFFDLIKHEHVETFSNEPKKHRVDFFWYSDILVLFQICPKLSWDLFQYFCFFFFRLFRFLFFKLFEPFFQIRAKTKSASLYFQEFSLTAGVRF